MINLLTKNVVLRVGYAVTGAFLVGMGAAIGVLGTKDFNNSDIKTGTYWAQCAVSGSTMGTGVAYLVKAIRPF